MLRIQRWASIAVAVVLLLTCADPGRAWAVSPAVGAGATQAQSDAPPAPPIADPPNEPPTDEGAAPLPSAEVAPEVGVGAVPTYTIDVPLDIVLLQDETGSMTDDISALRALAPQIWDSLTAVSTAGFRMSVAGFRDFARSGWGGSTDFVYRLRGDFTTSRAAFVSALALLTASGGADGPEAQYPALKYLALPAHPCLDSNGDGDCLDTVDTPAGQQPSFRSTDAVKVVLLATDASFHDPGDTSGYPGPTRNDVLAALQASRITVIGLVPGGQGRVPEVDDIAATTGGSVENTGSTGQAVAEAIARAVGKFQSVPGADGALYLSAPAFFGTAQPIRPYLVVLNPTAVDRGYSLEVALVQGDTEVSRTGMSLWVPARGEVSLYDVSFGVRPVGDYGIWAELRSDGKLLDRQGPVTVRVGLSDAQLRAIVEAGKLEAAAEAEWLEMRDMVADRYGESLSGLAAEAIMFAVGFLQEDVLKNVGEVSHLPALKTAVAIEEIAEHIAAVERWWEERVRKPIATSARETFDQDVQPLRAEVQQKQQEFGDFVRGTTIPTWTEPMADIVARYTREIGNRVEWEFIPGWNGVPPLFLGPTTLWWENAQYGFLKVLFEIVGYLLLAAAVLLLIVLAAKLTVASLGLAVPLIIKSAAALLALILAKGGVVKFGGAIAIFLIAMSMFFQARSFVAQAVLEQHNKGLEELVSRVDSATGATLEVADLQVSIEDGGAAITSEIYNLDPVTANPLIETTLYSASGDVIDVEVTDPRLEQQSSITLHNRYALRPGWYRVVTAVRGNQGAVVDAQATTFAVAQPEVAMSTWMESGILAPGEVAKAHVVITNTSPSSAATDLKLLVGTSDPANTKLWDVSLLPGERRQYTYAFVPLGAGAGRVRSTLSDGYAPLSVQDAAYVVGDGESLAANYDLPHLAQPDQDLIVDLRLHNGGTQAAGPVLTLLVFDLARQPALPIRAISQTVSLGAGQSQTLPLVVLPAGQAKSGDYSVQLFVDDDFYRLSEFSIAAAETLFVEVSPAKFAHSPGEAVDLQVRVKTAAYAYVDAEVTLSIWQPDGASQAVTMTWVATGQYQASWMPALAGTYVVTAHAEKPGYRSLDSSAVFVAFSGSWLQADVQGRPIWGITRPVTVTVTNEYGTPISGVAAQITGVGAVYNGLTDTFGQIAFQMSPVMTGTYQVVLQKAGFGQTALDLPVWIAPDVTAPRLYLNVPGATNIDPFVISGFTEPGAVVRINDQPVTIIDAAGYFTMTVDLADGTNDILAAASDVAGNQTVVTQTVILDVLPPVLTLTKPAETEVLESTAVNVVGAVEAAVLLTINGAPTPVDPLTGQFNAWVTLSPGANLIVIAAVDEAGNSAVIQRQVTQLVHLFLPMVHR